VPQWLTTPDFVITNPGRQFNTEWKIFIGGIMNIAQCVISPGGSILRSVEYPTLFASHLLPTLFASHFVCFSLSLLPIYTPVSWLLVPDFIQFLFPWKASYLNHVEAQFRNALKTDTVKHILSVVCPVAQSMALVPSPWKRALNVQAVSLKLLRNFLRWLY